MTRGVRWYLVSSLVLGALIALAGCSHYLIAEREPWRHEAELSCLNSGAVKETPERVRISMISGAGACGIDYPFRISALGDGPPLGYDDEAVRPPGSIPNAGAANGSMPQSWPGASPYAVQSNAIQSNALPPVQSAPQPYLATPRPYPASQPSAPSRGHKPAALPRALPSSPTVSARRQQTSACF